MSTAALHHYVAQFYLKCFTDKRRFWVFDKSTQTSFLASPRDVAAERNFYRIPEFVGTDADPLILERYFSEIEGFASEVIALFVERISHANEGEKLVYTRDEKWVISLYISLQFLRTAEQRRIVSLCAPNNVSEDERVNLHARIIAGDGNSLCERGAVRKIADRIYRSIWLFGRNGTATPFFTSDNPVVFRTADSKIRLKTAILSVGTYLAFPICPSIILFCHERTYWKKIAKFGNSLSPVSFTDELVDSENWGQMAMASRFVMSPDNSKHLTEFGRKYMKCHQEHCLAGRGWPYGESEWPWSPTTQN